MLDLCDKAELQPSVLPFYFKILLKILKLIIAKKKNIQQLSQNPYVPIFKLTEVLDVHTTDGTHPF